MNVLKPWQWAGVVIGIVLALYFIFFQLQQFGDVSFLGAILLLEVIIASLWNYDRRFFVLLMVTFVWAGMNVPLHSAGIIGRWVVLAIGAFMGFVVWIKAPRRGFRLIHLVAFFCICAAFVSATVSPFVEMASLKALSLSLLFLYCASGARLAAIGREFRFFQGLVWGSEITAYATAICYLVMTDGVWGNPNSLGAAMSIGVFPILLWGWLTSDGPITKLRRLVALLLCVYLVRFSMSRAAMIAMALVSMIFFVCLKRYKLLIKIVALTLSVIMIGGMLAPESLFRQLDDFKDTLLYKGHKEEGVLGSRRGPWDQSIASIKEHPFFGTGYGTSATGIDPGLSFGRTSSSAETEREHGSSYITIAEWVGLLGVLPFIALLAITASNTWRVCAWMNRTGNPNHYAVPLAMVVLSGFIHAGFEDWLFAVGSYLSLFMWVCAFLLAYLVPDGDLAPVASPAFPVVRSLSVDYGAVVSNR
jgi:O-antigen ligase